MLEQTQLFFSTLLGEGFDVTVIYAISACIAFLLIYGIILRPLLSIANGKKGKPIFDIIVVGLVLMIGFKLLFPDLFVKDGFTENDLQDYYDQGYSDGYDRGEGEGYDAGYADGLKAAGAETDAPETTEPEPELPTYESVEDACLALCSYRSTDNVSHFPAWQKEAVVDVFVANAETIEANSYASGSETLTGTAMFIVDGETWYYFAPDDVTDGYDITSDVRVYARNVV